MTVDLPNPGAPRLFESELRGIAQDAVDLFGDAADPVEVLSWVGRRVGKSRVAVSVSFSDGVLSYFAAQALPGVDVLFVDTYYHFAETLGVRDAVAATLPVNVRTLTPEQTVEQQDAQYGKDLWRTAPDLCCALRKVAPLAHALRDKDVWVTGLRRSDHAGRADVPLVAYDHVHQVVKVNPLVAYSDAQIADAVAEFGIVENPLREVGYRSIGCEPCTRPVAAGEDDRAGRWSGTAKTECGLHFRI